VAAPVAQHLAAALSVVLVRKLGVPGHPELAMGALAWVAGRLEVLRNESVIRSEGVTATDLARVTERERARLEASREALGDPTTPVEQRVVVLVDDGLATGSTMLAAVRAVRSRRPAEIVVAVPVAAAAAVALLRREADAVVCPAVPARFRAVGSAYLDFTQVDDREVERLLRPRGASPGEETGDPRGTSRGPAA
jgi:putative phosphoribosyl transferase